MKKVFLSLIILLSILLVGCDTIEDYKVQKELHEITPSTYISDDGKLVVIAKNDTAVATNMTFNITFYNEDKTILKEITEILEVVHVNEEVALGYDLPGEFINYEVHLDILKPKKSYLHLFEVSDTNNKKNIVVNFINKQVNNLKKLNVSVVYYHNEKIVGIKNKVLEEIKPNETTEIKFDYPKDRYSRTIKFTSYKVFVNDVY